MPVAHLTAMETVAVGRLTVSNIVLVATSSLHFVHGEVPIEPFSTSTRKHESYIRWSPNGVIALTCSQAFTSGTSSGRNGRMRISFEHKQTILLELAPPQHDSADNMAIVPMTQGERHPTSSDIGYLSRLVKKAR